MKRVRRERSKGKHKGALSESGITQGKLPGTETAVQASGGLS